MRRILAICFAAVITVTAAAQQTTIVKPKVSDAVLNNPGIGFTTFQRFNGDSLNQGVKWTEGMPIEYQNPNRLRDPGYPMTSIAYFRVYWRFLEPTKGDYKWEMVDRALETAHRRGQTLMVRIAPYGTGPAEDVPSWYRQESGETLDEKRPAANYASTTAKWMVNPENPLYAKYFGDFIRKFAQRYDGHPDLELVDISLLAAWGEGAGLELLTEATRRSLVDSYMDSFHRTLLVSQFADSRTVAYTLSRARNFGASNDAAAPLVGWRTDCMGDMGGFNNHFSHMSERYPENIIGLGLADAWKQAPVTVEACWVMQKWKNDGWSLREIMEQAIKWHVSSFNNKSSAVPEEWWPMVNEWLNHMGYRFALRRFEFNPAVDRTRRLSYRSWWENRGNAPVYRDYAVALRLTQGKKQIVLPLDANVRTWMPGDSLMDGSVFLPHDLADGEYELSIAMVDPVDRTPKIKLAIEGVADDGWFSLGTLKLQAEQK